MNTFSQSLTPDPFFYSKPHAAVKQTQQVIFTKLTNASLKTPPTETKSTATPSKPRNLYLDTAKSTPQLTPPNQIGTIEFPIN